MEASLCPLTDRSVLLMKLHNLKGIEDHLSTKNCCLAPRNLKDFIFDRNPAKGSTPLILACQHGEFDSVKYLVETWGVDVGTSAKYYSHPSQNYSLPIEIEIATPLFVAASHGHDKIVRYLLEKGADVSVKTYNRNANARNSYSIKYDGLSPLYGAVSSMHFVYNKPLLEQQEERSAVIRVLLEFGANPNVDFFNPSNGMPMWMEKLCGVDATTALINHGLDLKWQDPVYGTTLLHYIAALPHNLMGKDSLAIIKLLVDKGADLLTRDNSRFTPLLKAADHFNNNSPNLLVLDYFLEGDEYSLAEKIEAMELAGATILFKAKDIPHLITIAFDYWRRALHLRQMEKEISYEKILGRKIGRHVEWTTLAELDQLEQNPEDYRIQALLVKLRIVSGLGVYIHLCLSSQYIEDLSKSTGLNDEEKFDQILEIRWGIFDVAIHRWDLLSSNLRMWEVLDNVEQLVMTISAINEYHPTLINFEKIHTSLDLILLATVPLPFTIANEKHTNCNDGVLRFKGTRYASHLCYLLKIIFHLPVKPNKQNTTSLSQSLHRLGPHRLGYLLLKACYFYVRHSKPYFAIIRVLLEAGADPNVAVDEDDAGNASLHYAAELRDRQLCDAAGLLLVEFGASLQQVNQGGKTPLDIWIELNETKAMWNEEAGGWSARPEWCLPVLTLQCLAARVIRVHKIPYADGITPATLHSLIELR